MVFELDPNLALSGLVSDEGVLEQLLGRRAAGVRLHEAALNKVNKFLGPGTKEGKDDTPVRKEGEEEQKTVGSWSRARSHSRLPDSLSEMLGRKVGLQSLTRLLATSIMNYCVG